MLFILLISSQFQTASIINIYDEWYFLFLSPSLSYMTGGGERDRTDDLLLAKQALSQLSYTPNQLVGPGRLELPTSRLSGVRSNQAELRAQVTKLVNP